MTSSYRFKPPQRRKRVYVKKNAPFPVPIQSHTGQTAAQDNWYHYTGYLEGNHVVVKHTGDMEQLYRMGFFGKGDLSRHRPEYNRGGHWGIRKRRGLYGNQEVVRVLSRRRYLRHLAWQEGESGTDACGQLGEETTELPQSKKLRLAQEVEAGSLGNRVESGDVTDQPGTSSESHGNIDQSHERIQSDSESDSDTRDSDSGWPQPQEGPSDWPIASHDEDPWAVGDTKASEDFWGSTDSVTVTGTWRSKSHNDGKLEQVIQSEGKVEKNVENIEIVERSSPLGINQRETGVFQESECPGADESSRLEKSGLDSSHKHSEAKSDNQSTADTSHTLEDAQSSEPTGLSEPPFSKPPVSKKLKTDSTVEKSVREQTESDDDVNLDPRCLIEESSGKLLVVDDSDNSDCEWPDTRTKWRPVRKHEPYQIKENLCLMLEEAFFLSYALGCLVILKKDNNEDKNKNKTKNENRNKDDDSKPMDLSEMWREFCRIQPNFPTHYAAYHHYRAKGWVPKVGIKFGSDLILYRDGPPFNHSSYSVMIKTINDLDLKPDPKYDPRPLTWRSLSAFNRVTEQVNKEVLLCYVLHPENMGESELNSPECLKKFKIQEMIIHRWVSSQEREQSDSDLPT